MNFFHKKIKYLTKRKMSKIKDDNIEEIEETAFNGITYYIITFRGEKIGRLFEESKLTISEKQICENLLKRKRKNSDIIYLEKSKSTKKSKKTNIKRKDDLEKSRASKKYKKRNNKKEDNESYNNLSISSFSNIKTKSKKNKKEYNKENNNKYNNKNIYSEGDSDSDNLSYNKIKNEKKSESENNNENEREMKQTKLFEREGILLEDTPEEILNVGKKNRNDNNLYSLVKWKQYKNIKILDSIVENKKIRQAFPQLLIDYYESKIIFLEE